MNTNIISVHIDDYNLIQVAKNTLGVSENSAAAAIIEIGLFNILNFPTGNEKMDKILSNGKFPLLVSELKKVWSV